MHCFSCDYIAQWEYPLNKNYLHLVVRSKRVEYWVGIGIKHSVVGTRLICFVLVFPLVCHWHTTEIIAPSDASVESQHKFIGWVEENLST